MGVAVLIPITYGTDTVPGLIMLGAVYCGATYGGSISAVLLNTPGTPGSAATALDGHKLTQKGLAREALTESVVASFWGGLASSIALLFLAPLLAKFSLRFGPQEKAMLGIFGLTIIASLCSKDLLKGVIGGFLGLLLACVGLDPVHGDTRFTFGTLYLTSGVALIPALIGLYSIPQVINMVVSNEKHIVSDEMLKQIGKSKFKFKEIFQYPRIYLDSSIIGVLVGILPGAGATIASFLAIDHAKKHLAKEPEEFGKGSREAVAASEAGNNGVTGGALIPMLTLGVPGDAVSAIMMGGLMIKGLYPGSELFTKQSGIVYPFIIGFLLVQFFMLIEGIFGAKWFAKIVKVPSNFLAVGIVVLTTVGAFAMANNIYDVICMFVFGVLGYLLNKIGFDSTPIVLGLILGSIMEQGLAQASTITGGYGNAFLSMLSRPVCLVLIALSVLSLAFPAVQNKLRARKQKK